MSIMKKLDDMELGKVTGGNAGADPYSWVQVMANVQTGYLALRSFPAYNDANIIAKINNGTNFQVTYDQQDGDYIMGRYNGNIGWVNRNYIADLSNGISR